MKVKITLKEKDRERYKEKRRHEEMKRLTAVFYEKFLIDEIKQMEQSGVLEKHPSMAICLDQKKEALRKAHEYNQKMGYTIEEAAE